MRILWVSNSPHTVSGYGTQTRLIIERLKAAGHDVAVQCTHGIEHEALDYKGIPLFPKGQHYWSQDVIGDRSRQWKADITICFLDAWVMEPWKYGPQVRAVTLFPVDHEPMPRKVIQSAKGFWDRIVYSKSALAAAAAANLPAHYAPHGVETSVFHPMDREQARRQSSIPEGHFIVGCVAANHDFFPSRKNWENTIKGFSLFVKEVPNALLYIHAPLVGGVDIKEWIYAYGIERSVLHSPVNSSQNKVEGLPDSAMRALYNSFDVLLQPSLGEGFCLPLLEAQSCGCPVITGAWTAMEEMCLSGLTIGREEAYPCEDEPGVFQYRASAETIAQRLKIFYDAQPEYGQFLRETAREKALEYDIDTVFKEYWIPTLGAMAERISEENASVGVSIRPKPDTAYRVAVRDAVIQSVEADPPTVVIVCPSAGEKCGIAEYAKSVQKSLNAAKIPALIVPTVEVGCVAALVAESVKSLIVLHEYAFFDDMNRRLGRSETTAGMVKALAGLRELKPDVAVAIQLHTVTEQNGEGPLNTYLSRACKDLGIRLFATTMQGALFLSSNYGANSDFLPLGAWEIKTREIEPKSRDFSIGNFGMFGAHRDIGGHIDLCVATDSRFVGSFYCEFAVQAESLNNALAKANLLDTACIFTDWADESEVVRRLSLASCLYMPRPEVGNHYAAASVVTAMSARRPIIINRAGCYEDLWDTLLVADTIEEAKQVVSRLKSDPAYYRLAVERIEKYFVERDIARIWKESGLV